MDDALMRNQTFASPQEALAHHGVKGMRWGVRKDGEPGSNRGPASKPKEINEKKAQKHESNAKAAQQQIDELVSKGPAKFAYFEAQRQQQIRDVTNYRDVQKKAAEDVRAGRLTDGQRHALVGLAVAGGVLAAYGAYKYTDSGTFQQHKVNLGEKISDQKFQLNRKEVLKHYSDPDDVHKYVVKPINSDFGAFGTKMNCRRCTFAYEMRRRGYDAKAVKSHGGTGQNAVGLHNATTPGSKLPTGKYGIVAKLMREDDDGPMSKLVASQKSSWGNEPIRSAAFFQGKDGRTKAGAIFGKLSRQPDGSRGELGVGWTFGGGHSMSYEIFKGVPVVFDNQTGKIYKSPKDFEKFAESITEAGFTRLDNVRLNDEFLKRWVQNAD